MKGQLSRNQITMAAPLFPSPSQSVQDAQMSGRVSSTYEDLVSPLKNWRIFLNILFEKLKSLNSFRKKYYA